MTCVHCGAEVWWSLPRMDDPCFECGKPVGRKHGRVRRFARRVWVSIIWIGRARRIGKRVGRDLNRAWRAPNV